MWEITIKKDGCEQIILKCIDDGFSAKLSRELAYDDMADEIASSVIKHLEIKGIIL